MGKWIAALVICILFVAPVPFLLANSQPLSDLALSWFAPKDEAALGQNYLDDIRADKLLPVLKALESTLHTQGIGVQLAKMSKIFPDEKPRSVTLVGSQTMKSGGVTRYYFSYEYAFAKSWVLASITLERSGDQLRIAAANVQPMATSLSQRNALTLVGKSQTQYVFAAAAAALFLFWVVSVFACLFTPMERRKWLWVLFVMVGFMGLNMNWTTGAVSFVAINIGVPTVRAWSNTYSPWIIQITLPLGAIVFWLRRRDLMAVARTAETDMRR